MIPQTPRTLSSLAAAILFVLVATSRTSTEVTYEYVANFSSISASVPLAGLVRGPDGALYGTTNSEEWATAARFTGWPSMAG